MFITQDVLDELMTRMEKTKAPEWIDAKLEDNEVQDEMLRDLLNGFMGSHGAEAPQTKVISHLINMCTLERRVLWALDDVINENALVLDKGAAYKYFKEYEDEAMRVKHDYDNDDRRDQYTRMSKEADRRRSIWMKACDLSNQAPPPPSDEAVNDAEIWHKVYNDCITTGASHDEATLVANDRILNPPSQDEIDNADTARAEGDAIARNAFQGY